MGRPATRGVPNVQHVTVAAQDTPHNSLDDSIIIFHIFRTAVYFFGNSKNCSFFYVRFVAS
jgi:hypothetical protein